MGRRKANGRHIMFACRLSEAEHEDLQEFLELAEGMPTDKSEQFRAMLSELRGRLTRNEFGELAYDTPESYRIVEEQPEEEEKPFKFRVLSKIR